MTDVMVAKAKSAIQDRMPGAATAGSKPAQAPIVRLRELWATVWPMASVALAAIVWWPAGFSGRGEWMTMPLTAATGDAVLLGTWVAAGVVGALVRTPWPKFGLVFGLTSVAWMLSGPVAGAVTGERTGLAALAAIGSLLGVWLGSKAGFGPIQFAVMLAWVSGLSPATWSRSWILAVAVALPFAVATADRVGPTMWAIVRVILTWLAAVVASLALRAAWVAIPAGGLATPVETARGVAQRFIDHVRANGLDIGRAALENSTEWLPMSFLIAVTIVGVRVILARRPIR